jgi:hypothetical protein
MNVFVGVDIWIHIYKLTPRRKFLLEMLIVVLIVRYVCKFNVRYYDVKSLSLSSIICQLISAHSLKYGI